MTTDDLTFSPLPDPAQPTTLGYAVSQVAHYQAQWGFNDDMGHPFFDGYGSFFGDLTAFVFLTPIPPGGYYTSAGVYAGHVEGGSVQGFFTGSAGLTISEESSAQQLPEPGTASLGVLALGLLGGLRWGRGKAR